MNMQDKEIPAQPGSVSDDLIKSSLMRRFRTGFIDWLTRADLDELQFYLRNQFDKNHQWNSAYRRKFEHKLQQYFPEEVLRREIASIEVLIGMMEPGDLTLL
jgi:hypothetical protein